MNNLLKIKMMEKQKGRKLDYEELIEIIKDLDANIDNLDSRLTTCVDKLIENGEDPFALLELKEQEGAAKSREKCKNNITPSMESARQDVSDILFKDSTPSNSRGN